LEEEKVDWLGVREILPTIGPDWRDQLRAQLEGKSAKYRTAASESIVCIPSSPVRAAADAGFAASAVSGSALPGAPRPRVAQTESPALAWPACPQHHGERQPSAIRVPRRETGGTTLFSLTGLDGSVAVDGRTITVKRDSGEGSGKPIVLAAESVRGAAVWTGVLTGQFSVHYSPGSPRGVDAPPLEFLSVQFKAADKEWWDAMASAVIGAVSRSNPSTGGPVADKAVTDAIPAAPPTFDRWLNRTLGLDTQNPAGSDR
jgi:hypothetical protein